MQHETLIQLFHVCQVILAAGGLYAFQIRAREIIPGRGFGDEVVTNVTIVVTDQNDEIPTFNRDNFTVAVPEDVGTVLLPCKSLTYC